jgi:hypothetical protein
MPDDSIEELRKQLDELRDKYITATPRQRLGRVRERLDDPGANPNRLVTLVGGIEALARSLAMHAEHQDKEELRACYPRYRNRKTQTLVEEYCKSRGIEVPKEYFGEENWELFLLAIGYRNLLAHESTFLSNQRFGRFEMACNEVLLKLANLAKLKWDAA